MSPHAIKTIAKIAEDIALGVKGVDARRGARRILDILEREGLIPPVEARS